MDANYLDQMQCHVDEGGKLSHLNGVALLAEVTRLRKAIADFRSAAGRHEGEHEAAAYSVCAKCDESYIKAEAALDAALSAA